MTRVRATLAMLALFVATSGGVAAHKPITSPFTYAADVAPILKTRCGACHRPGGVAPMSLLTHVDAVPWGESIRTELLAGHMPPWSVERGAGRFRNSDAVTAREFNVLLTWVTGGTPAGDLAASTSGPIVEPGWSLGTPDEVLTLPRVTLGATEQERIADFTLAGRDEDRVLRAVDLLPGTPAIVRSATVEVAEVSRAGAARQERLLLLWVPGDQAAALDPGALKVPAGTEMHVRVRYRKTWEYERKEMSDQSRIGLYFAAAGASAVQVASISPDATVTLPRAARIVGIYPDPALADTSVVVTATRPDGRRTELIAFRPQRNWARRYWLREPMSLPRGTRLRLRATRQPAALLSPGVSAPSDTLPVPRVFVNFVM